jgi:hypothetical protein
LEYDFEASGFLVALPSERCKGNSFFYFVTAAHVLKGALLNGDQDPKAIRYGVRVNLRQGGTKAIPIDRWYTHPSDGNADVAVAPFENDYLNYDIKFLPNTLFTVKEAMDKMEIGIGDEVYFPGLFSLTQQESDSRNLPILRMGNIVMLPNVKVPSELGPMDAYLVEARSIGGISGSPVFSRRTMSLLWNDSGVSRSLHGMTGDVHLIGMMHGHWDVKESEINQVGFTPLERGHQGVNLGIALVIPMGKIIETLNHPALAKIRTEQEDVFLKGQRGATCD